LLLERQK